jgi:sortase A
MSTWELDDAPPVAPPGAKRAGTAVAERPAVRVRPAPVVTPSTPARAPTRAEVWGVVRTGLGVFAGLALALAGYLFWASGLQHDADQTLLERRFTTELAAGTALIGGAIPPGTPVAVVEIPAIGLREVVVEGTTSGLTRHGPGHVRATPLPGQAGNAVLLGRRTTFGAPFGDLDGLPRGAVIRITTGQGRSRYRVVGTGTVDASRRAVFASRDAGGTLSLVTSDPPVVADRYQVTRARLVSPPKARTSHLQALPGAELGLAAEGGITLALVLWVQLLLVTGLAATWLFLRWRRWPAYLVSVPVLITATWLVFENVARLLPATL